MTGYSFFRLEVGDCANVPDRFRILFLVSVKRQVCAEEEIIDTTHIPSKLKRVNDTLGRVQGVLS